MKKNASDDVMAEAEYETTRFTKPSGITTPRYAEELVKKTFRCRDAHEMYALNGILSERSLDPLQCA